MLAHPITPVAHRCRVISPPLSRHLSAGVAQRRRASTATSRTLCDDVSPRAPRGTPVDRMDSTSARAPEHSHAGPLLRAGRSHAPSTRYWESECTRPIRAPPLALHCEATGHLQTTSRHVVLVATGAPSLPPRAPALRARRAAARRPLRGALQRAAHRTRSRCGGAAPSARRAPAQTHGGGWRGAPDEDTLVGASKDRAFGTRFLLLAPARGRCRRRRALANLSHQLVEAILAPDALLR